MITIEAKYDKTTKAWDFTFKSSSFRSGKVMKEALVALLKQRIPAAHRDYNPTTFTWSVLEQYWPILKDLWTKMNIKIHEITPPITEENFFYEEALNSKPVPESRESLQQKLAKMLEITDLEIFKDSVLLKKAYRAAALKLHPDRNNGDGSKMSELNSIWSVYNGQ